MSTWGGVTFTVLAEGAKRTRGAETAVTHIPYGDVNILHQGGRLPKRRHYMLQLSSEADYLSLESQEGDSGTLVGPEGAGTALLDKIESIEDFPSGQVNASSDWILS